MLLWKLRNRKSGADVNGSPVFVNQSTTTRCPVRKPYSTIFYVLMVAIGLMAMYTILNAGNPKSFWRPYFPDTTSDIYLAMGFSVVVFVLGFVVYYTRDREGFKHLIEMNADRIRGLPRRASRML